MQCRTPFDINLGTDVFFTLCEEDTVFGAKRCEEDTVFGATVDAYSTPWHLMALGNPIYTVERIEQTTSHAVLSVVSCASCVLACRDWTAKAGVYRVMQLAAHKFKFLAPRSALGITDCSTGACFNVDVLIVQNALAAQKFPVPPFALNKLARHFKGRISLLPPEYESTWTVPPSQALRAGGAHPSQFSNVEESPEAMVTQLAAQYRHLGLQTVVKLDTAGTYGNLYALLEDKIAAGNQKWQARGAPVEEVRIVYFIRQADNFLALVTLMSRKHSELWATRRELNRYKDSCYVEGMWVLLTASAGSDSDLPDSLEWCGMEVTFSEGRVSAQQLLQNEK
ncbi:hypothetical protein CYMTET_14505 [Cymbomonas tetramitiformis]|uniref:Uncharacterized protein n=1 Tax=Cymbomonas tetramitiformis TaxID=36881 RepID=A0AAE0GG81_9CHLO|nr:hypothetical protein CYMTET_14505 [Cymbomonas tetramitiformis]